MYDLIIRDATIVHAGGRLVADVAIEDGRVAFVGGNPGGPARQDLSGIGRFLIPGCIDGDVRIDAPGADLPALWAAETRAAVTRGVTTFLHRAAQPTSLADLDATLAAAAAGSVFSFGVWAVAGADQDAALAERVAQGGAVGLSLRVSDGAADIDRLRALHGQTTGLLGVLAEDPALVAQARERWAKTPAPLHDDVHSSKAALEAAQHILALVRSSPRPVHLHQLSTANELNLYDPFHDEVPLTAGVTPQHLFLSTDTTDQAGGLLKIDPPVRPELDRRALWTAIKRNRVEVFSSGHVPLSRAHKAGGYRVAPSGLPGAETLLPLLLAAVKNGRLGMERLVEMCSEAPARIFGLQGKGRIQVGADADMLMFTEGVTRRLQESELRSSAGWSPFVGREVGAPPQLVVVAGRIVAQDGRLVGDPALGAPLRYSR